MNEKIRELGDKAVAELRAHGGLPALADFLQATLNAGSEPVTEPPPPPEPNTDDFMDGMRAGTDPDPGPAATAESAATADDAGTNASTAQ